MMSATTMKNIKSCFKTKVPIYVNFQVISFLILDTGLISINAGS